MPETLDLRSYSVLYVRQIKEMAELFGFETRNKYNVLNESGAQVALAAEESQGFFGAIGRQFFGHWRQYTVKLYNPGLAILLELQHPFRLLFQRLDIIAPDGRKVGAIQERWSLLHKHFDLLDVTGQTILQVRSPLLKFWTFNFVRPDGRDVALVEKKWSGTLKEMFTDADNFRVQYSGREATNDEKLLILAAAIFIDLRYFERKAN